MDPSTKPMNVKTSHTSNLGNLCHHKSNTGLLIAVVPRYRYCSGTTFTVGLAVAPLLLAESSGDGSAATFIAAF